MRTSPLADAAVRRSTLREVGAITQAWGRATPEAKREIVGHLATAARLAVGKRCAFSWRSAADLADRGG